MICLGFPPFFTKVNDSFQSDVAINVGGQPSKIVHGFVGAKGLGKVAGEGVKELFVGEWSSASEDSHPKLGKSQGVVAAQSQLVIGVGGQPSRFGASESEDSHRVRVS
ncbi:unnamed protein product [Heligmosomoides polygyrus]|uniref:Uncharacterized protein n=1 Tax=Heligmosomoides polygyrus TaxID=6339 RepID=A0A183GE85_HELPZ|nr:unnamed protein product [Heligmosomoides polygyrus]